MAETQRSWRIDWRAGILTGIIAGLVFLVLEMIMVPLFAGGSPWAPPRMMAAVVLGSGVLPPPATFEIGVFIVALIVHLILSIVFGVVLGAVLEFLSLELTLAVVVGGVFGLVLYVINFYGFTAIFPWFSNARTWITIFAHIVFGLLASWLYLRLTQPAAA